MIDCRVAHVRFCRLMFRLLALVVFLPLSACTILPETPISQIYLLPAQPASVTGGQPLKQPLRVIQPSTNQFLNGSRIAVQPQGTEITAFSGSRWSDPVPLLLRNRLIQEFRTTGRFCAVTSDDDNLHADWELGGELSAFQGVYNGDQGEVVIRFDARLVRTVDRRVIANQNFVVHQPISGRTMDNVVKAFGLASDQLATQMLRWTLEQPSHATTTCQ